LGLGYTAQAVLEDERVQSLVVVEALAEVIAWHERGLLPIGAQLARDPRSRLVQGDFFAMLGSADGAFGSELPARRFHAILVDIDHAPGHLLHPSHAAFYAPAGLRRLAALLQPAGVFGLWSNDPPDGTFRAALEEVFESVAAHVVAFPNHQQDRDATNTVYVATAAAAA
jgi:spermidine synthase